MAFLGSVCVRPAHLVCIIENRRWSNDDDDVNRWPKSWNKMLSNERPWRLCYYDFAAAAAATATQPPAASTVDNSFCTKLKLVQILFLPFFNFIVFCIEFAKQNMNREQCARLLTSLAHPALAHHLPQWMDVRACHCERVRYNKAQWVRARERGQTKWTKNSNYDFSASLHSSHALARSMKEARIVCLEATARHMCECLMANNSAAKKIAIQMSLIFIIMITNRRNFRGRPDLYLISRSWHCGRMLHHHRPIHWRAKIIWSACVICNNV